jgi:hypothetical protein
MYPWMGPSGRESELLDMDVESEDKDTPAEHGRAKRTGGAYRGTDG